MADLFGTPEAAPPARHRPLADRLRPAALDQVMDEIEKIQKMNTHIATSATEQSAVATDINSTMSRLQQLSDNSQQSAVEVEHSSNELASLAKRLQGLIGQFKY